MRVNLRIYCSHGFKRIVTRVFGVARTDAFLSPSSASACVKLSTYVATFVSVRLCFANSFSFAVSSPYYPCVLLNNSMALSCCLLGSNKTPSFSNGPTFPNFWCYKGTLHMCWYPLLFVRGCHPAAAKVQSICCPECDDRCILNLRLDSVAFPIALWSLSSGLVNFLKQGWRNQTNHVIGCRKSAVFCVWTHAMTKANAARRLFPCIHVLVCLGFSVEPHGHAFSCLNTFQPQNSKTNHVCVTNLKMQS